MARRDAANSLLAFLLDAKTPYHVIAHSHGGSVLWRALAIAIRQGHTLDKLQTTTTVGTPFLNFRTEPLNLWAIVPMVASAIGVVLSVRLVPTFVAALPDLIEDRQTALLALSPILWLILLVFTLFTGYRSLVGILAKVQLKREWRNYQAAWKKFGPKWLGIWSTNDEAINGLSATVAIRGRLVPAIPTQFLATAAPWKRRPLLACALLPFSPFVLAFLVFSLFYNRILCPYVLDSYVWDVIRRKTQGNDLPGMRLVSVSVAPLPATPGYPPLPIRIDERLLEQANSVASKAVPRLRSGLALAASSDVESAAALRWLVDNLRGEMLVHSSYFQTDEILTLLTSFITNSNDWRGSFADPLRDPPGKLATERVLSNTNASAEAGTSRNPRLSAHGIATLLMVLCASGFSSLLLDLKQAYADTARY
jgi:hypothetical protein